jgi:hypothetical protein
MAVAICFTAPVEFLVDLKAASRAEDINKSKLLRTAFYQYLANKRAKAEEPTDTPDDFDPTDMLGDEFSEVQAA